MPVWGKHAPRALAMGSGGGVGVCIRNLGWNAGLFPLWCHQTEFLAGKIRPSGPHPVNPGALLGIGRTFPVCAMGHLQTCAMCKHGK